MKFRFLVVMLLLLGFVMIGCKGDLLVFDEQEEEEVLVDDGIEEFDVLDGFNYVMSMLVNFDLVMQDFIGEIVFFMLIFIIGESDEIELGMLFIGVLDFIGVF